ncbi:hypothetical protein LWI28_003934 [Acer negundo]|uniref:GAG-pre-integrase domain-containing protein n=1 Tax=Acer negundo TaxID=4023 RepID=A0AAD5I944_ACENE|nr:hypothetical protein LWI28_003934 [Acer negundo]
MGHWVQTCYVLNGYPTSHPKAKVNSGSKRFSNHNKPVAYHVLEGFSKEEGNRVVGISEAQLKQLLSLVDNKNEGSSSQAHVDTKPGFSKDLATKKMIGLGKQCNGLYYLVAVATKKSVTMSSSHTNQPACNLITSSADLRHNCLGHASPPRLGFIAKNFLNCSIQSNNACPICPLAKQSHLLFSHSVISSTKSFEIIHYDIWGRYRHPYLSGAYYFLTIVDDFTRFT